MSTDNATPESEEAAAPPAEVIETDETPEETGGIEPGLFWSAKIAEMGDEHIVVDLGDGATGRFEAREAVAADKTAMVSVGDEVEVLIDDLEGDVWAVSMEKAEKVRVFERLVKLAKDRTRIKGVITRQVRGGLSVDIGVRAFLPGRESGIRRRDAGRFIGRVVECQIQRFDRKKGEVVLTRRKIAEEAINKRKSEIYGNLEVGKVITGQVSSITKFGVFVDIGGADGLLHVSEMAWDRVGDPAKLYKVGDEVEVQIVEIDQSRDRVGLSRKSLLENPWDVFAAANPAGSTIKGTVRNLTDFGAFVDVGGVEGLIHISELSWDRNIKKASDVLNKGDEVDVYIKEIDIAGQRLSLSVKRLQPNPWEVALANINVGDKLEGPVRSVVDFGIFVEVVPGVEGLCHVSDMSWTERIASPMDFREFKEGEPVEVMVLKIEPDRNRISLGIKQLEQDPWDAANIKVGAELEVTISRIAAFGAFATIVPGLEGLIHVSEMATERVERIEDVVKTGQTVKVRVLEADRAKNKVGLSIKAQIIGEGGGMREFKEDGNAGTSLGDLMMARGLVEPEPAPEEDDAIEEVEAAPAEETAEETVVEEAAAEEAAAEEAPATEEAPEAAAEEAPAEEEAKAPEGDA